MTTNEQYNVPELRFPEFEEKWVEKSLSDLFTFKNGINAVKEDYGTGYKFINVLDIIGNDYITNDTIIGSVNVSLDVFNKNIVEFGDILFQRSSETRNEVGQANVYLDKDKPATFGGFVIRGKAKEEYDPLFMNSLLKTKSSRKEITSKSGGSTRYNVGQDTLSSVNIFTTNIKEQTKISTFLTTVDKRLKLLQAKKV
jgi:type I restriction enzyme S subunit